EARADAAEVLVEQVDAVLRLDVRELEVGVGLCSTSTSEDAVAGEQRCAPGADDPPTMVVAPAAKASEHDRPPGGEEALTVCFLRGSSEVPQRAQGPVQGTDASHEVRSFRMCLLSRPPLRGPGSGASWPRAGGGAQ